MFKLLLVLGIIYFVVYRPGLLNSGKKEGNSTLSGHDKTKDNHEGEYIDYEEVDD